MLAPKIIETPCKGFQRRHSCAADAVLSVRACVHQGHVSAQLRMVGTLLKAYVANQTQTRANTNQTSGGGYWDGEDTWELET